MIMAQSYLNNIKDLQSSEFLYKFIYKIYPELENIKPLDLASILELSDFFSWFSDDVISLSPMNETQE